MTSGFAGGHSFHIRITQPFRNSSLVSKQVGRTIGEDHLLRLTEFMGLKPDARHGSSDRMPNRPAQRH